MRGILKAHILKYPDMELRDAVKLVYQSIFGCAHLIKDRATCEKRMSAELAKSKDFAETDAFEDIGGGYIRFYLNSAEAREIPAAVITDMFIETSLHNVGTVEKLENALQLMRDMIEDGTLPFSIEEFDEYVAEYKVSGYPAVSHSVKYNKLYAPAYRVILKEYAAVYDAVKAISKVLNNKEKCVVAIDGKAASGKTTLAGLLQRTFDAAVIHMDDFFLPIELRTEKRLSAAGGNVHYERFNHEVSENLSYKGQFEYQAFDCSKMQLSEFRIVEDKPVVIVEGAYCMHPKITAEYDVTLFLNIESEMQQSRILKRNGAEMLKNFVNEWIPMENAYIEAYGIKEKCDIIINA